MRQAPLSDGTKGRALLLRSRSQVPAVQSAQRAAPERPQKLLPNQKFSPGQTILPNQIAAQTNAEAGALFRQIRLVTGLSLPQTAQRLHTTPGVIAALELGELHRLPPWPETVLIVSGFTALAGIDPRPVLAAIKNVLDDKIIDVQATALTPATLTPRQYPARTAIAPPSETKNAANRSPRKAAGLPQGAHLTRPRAQRLRQTFGQSFGQTFGQAFGPALGHSMSSAAAVCVRVLQPAMRVVRLNLDPLMVRRLAAVPGLRQLLPPWRRQVMLSLAVTVPLALLLSFEGAGVLQGAASILPQPLSGAVRRVEDVWLRTFATQKNGLTWIEVSDPRSRKTDKLPGPRR